LIQGLSFSMNHRRRIVIIGGGAAGIFAAAVCAEKAAGLEIIVLEKTRQLLSKVRISGGGRCNVTHAQFDPRKLTSNYPRGNKELFGPFHRFQPQDTIAWFNRRGVELKIEADGRMFPVTDCSATIINCLLSAAKEGSVDIRNEHMIQSIEKKGDSFVLHLEKQDPLECDYLILATGSNPHGHQLAASLGHAIVPSVPSLFTFNTPTSPLNDLAGIAVEDAEISLKTSGFKQRGNLLITHWGFSGPAALKLSAWAARDLHACNYRTELYINWIPSFKNEEALDCLSKIKQQRPQRTLDHENPFHLPMNLWKRLLALSDIPLGAPMGHLPKKTLLTLVDGLTRSTFAQDGKTTYKQEFVTCGGVPLKEVDFKTMESRLVKNLFFAGEVLDIDGVTGGFNFQNAWTTAYLAASCIAARINVTLAE
jgi:predicted Rossmann fold flavoprotein